MRRRRRELTTTQEPTECEDDDGVNDRDKDGEYAEQRRPGDDPIQAIKAVTRDAAMVTRRDHGEDDERRNPEQVASR